MTRRKVPISKRLADLRRDKGVSLRVAADGIGCARNHLWELETGGSANPSLAILQGAAAYYGVTIAYIVGESEAA